MSQEKEIPQINKEEYCTCINDDLHDIGADELLWKGMVKGFPPLIGSNEQSGPYHVWKCNVCGGKYTDAIWA